MKIQERGPCHSVHGRNQQADLCGLWWVAIPCAFSIRGRGRMQMLNILNCASTLRNQNPIGSNRHHDATIMIMRLACRLVDYMSRLPVRNWRCTFQHSRLAQANKNELVGFKAHLLESGDLVYWLGCTCKDPQPFSNNVYILFLFCLSGATTKLPTQFWKPPQLCFSIFQSLEDSELMTALWSALLIGFLQRDGNWKNQCPRPPETPPDAKPTKGSSPNSHCNLWHHLPPRGNAMILPS